MSKAKDWITIKEVRTRVTAIELMRRDDERAHSGEDALHQAVLEEIAEGHPHPRQIAAEALKTTEIEFDRWYA